MFLHVCVILFTGGCYPSIRCRWYPGMPCSRGVSPPGGSPPGGGVSSGGGGGWPSVIAFCCGLLLWPSGLVAFWLKAAFWYGLWGGRRPPHQKATTQEAITQGGGCLVETPLQAHTQREIEGGIRSRPTPKGEIQGDQVQANIQVGNSGGSGPDPPPDDYCCGRYVSYWNAFLFLNIYMLINLFRIIIMTHCDALTCYAVA